MNDISFAHSCIYMKTKKMRENRVKTISLGKGLRYNSSCTPKAFNFMPNCTAGPSECETKFTSKHFDIGHAKSHGFHGNPFTIFENGGWPTN